MADDDITTGELGRRIAAVELSVRDGFAQLRKSIDDLSYVHVDRYEADQRGLERRIGVLEGRLTWAARTIAASIVGMIGSAILALFAARGGV